MDRQSHYRGALLGLAAGEMAGPHVEHHASPIIQRYRPASARLSLRVAYREAVLFEVNLFAAEKPDFRVPHIGEVCQPRDRRTPCPAMVYVECSYEENEFNEISPTLFRFFRIFVKRVLLGSLAVSSNPSRTMIR